MYVAVILMLHNIITKLIHNILWWLGTYNLIILKSGVLSFVRVDRLFFFYFEFEEIVQKVQIKLFQNANFKVHLTKDK